MKKNILFLFLTISSISHTWAADFTVISCADTRISAHSSSQSCQTCFDAGVLYYRSNQTIENLGNFTDKFYFSGTGTRVMWQDETSVAWGQIPGTESKFTLGSSLSSNRMDTHGFKFVDIGPESLCTSASCGWFANNANTRFYSLFKNTPTAGVLYTQSSGVISLNSVTSSATSADRNKPMWYIKHDAASRVYNGPGDQSNTLDHHIQCSYLFPRWCGDNIVDNGSNGTQNKGEQCDDGNMTSGDGCSNACQTETTNTLACTNLTLAPTTVSKDGDNITATCTATNATEYKFVLKQDSTIIQTRNYLNTSTATFDLPANTTPNGKTYTVDCYVKNATPPADITSASCNKSITVPGTTPVEPAVCNSLTLSHATIQTNTPVNYICSATNATSYIIKEGTNILGTQPEGTFNFSTAGTYSIGCFIDGKTTTPVSCAKNIIVTNPPISPIPSIFIDKDDSTPGTPDSDGNDIQRVQNNGTATFTIRVFNNGNEALKTVVIDDSLSSDCARTSTQTAALYAGGATANFDVNESFNYQCTKTNVIASTFPNNRNTASVKGVGVTSSTNVTDSDVTEIIIKQLNPSIIIEKDDDDNSDDEQEIDEDDTAKFSVKVTNNGDEALENVIITDELSRDCEKDESETRDLIRTVGNRDSLFDPDEVFMYTCQEKSVQTDTFPDEINTVCTQANGVDTDGDVDDCDDTNIITNDKIENLMCLNIESSKGSFGGAPFRTTITCDAVDYDSCEIEVMLDGEVIDTYDACSQSITLSDKGNYSVACIVNNERTPDCEMEIEVAAMTDIPTGTKIFILAFLSILLTALGTHLYKKRTS